MEKITFHTERLDLLGIVRALLRLIQPGGKVSGHYDAFFESKVMLPFETCSETLGHDNPKGLTTWFQPHGVSSQRKPWSKTPCPLYLTPEFFANKPIDLLIEAGITAEMLNDDSLKRAPFALFEAGLTEVFAKVASKALHKHGIAQSLHPC
jgi:hypothetical protein